MAFYGRPQPAIVGTPYGPQPVYPPQQPGFYPAGGPPVHGSTPCPQCLQYHAPNLPCPTVGTASQAPSRAASRSRRRSTSSSSSDSSSSSTVSTTGSSSSSSSAASRASGRRRDKRRKDRQDKSHSSSRRGRSGRPQSKKHASKMKKRRSPSPSGSSSSSSTGSGSSRSRSDSRSSSDGFHPSAAQLLAIGERAGQSPAGHGAQGSSTGMPASLAMPAPVYPRSSLLPSSDAGREQYYRDILQSYSRTPSRGRVSGSVTPSDGQLHLQLEAQRLRHLLEERAPSTRSSSRTPIRPEFGSIGYAASQLPSLPAEARLSSAHPSAAGDPLDADGYFAAGELHRRSHSGGGSRPGMPRFPSSYMPSPADPSQIEAAMQHKSISEIGFPASKPPRRARPHMGSGHPVTSDMSPVGMQAGLSGNDRSDLYHERQPSRAPGPDYMPYAGSPLGRNTRMNARVGAGAASVAHPLQTVPEQPATSFCGLCYGSGR